MQVVDFGLSLFLRSLSYFFWQETQKLEKCPICETTVSHGHWTKHLDTDKHRSAIYVKYGNDLRAVPTYLRPPPRAPDSVPAAAPHPAHSDEKQGRHASVADLDMQLESDARGIHASEVEQQSPPRSSRAGQWDHIPPYFPWACRERMELDIWRTVFGVGDEEFSWLLRILGQSWFQSARVWRSLDEYNAEQQKIPRPKVIERQVSSIVNSRSGPRHAIIAELSLIEHLQRLLADPLVRATLNLEPRDLHQPDTILDFLDTPFSRDPSLTADSVSFFIRNRDINSPTDGRLMLGDCAEVKDGKESFIVRVVKLSYGGDGNMTVECEQLLSARGLRQHCRAKRLSDPLHDVMQLDNELFLLRERVSFEPSAFVRRVDVSSVAGRGEFVCQREFVRRDLVPCGFDDLQREFTVSLPVSLASGKVFWIILYIDGEFVDVS